MFKKLNTLRGTILEDHIKRRSNAASKAMPHKDVVKHLVPDLDPDCLRLAEPKICQKLIELDEQCVINKKNYLFICEKIITNFKIKISNLVRFYAFKL